MTGAQGTAHLAPRELAERDEQLVRAVRVLDELDQERGEGLVRERAKLVDERVVEADDLVVLREPAAQRGGGGSASGFRRTAKGARMHGEGQRQRCERALELVQRERVVAVRVEMPEGRLKLLELGGRELRASTASLSAKGARDEG